MPDGASVVVAALEAPAGIYNVSDDNPVTFADNLRLLTEAVRAPRPWHIPAILGPILAGVAWKYLLNPFRGNT